MKMSRTFGVLCAILLHSNILSAGVMWSRDAAMDNFTPNCTDTASDSVTAPSPGACALACSGRPWCNSFVHEEGSYQCFLYSLVFKSGISEKVSSPGSRYFVVNSDWCRREEGFTYDRLTGLCWMVTVERKMWLQNNASCTAQGLSLITLDTTAKKDIVTRSLLEDPDAPDVMHVGASRPVDMWDTAWPDGQHDIHWVTGQRVDITVDREFWRDGEPSNSLQDQNIVVLSNKADGRNYLLDDASGAFRKRCICEKRQP